PPQIYTLSLHDALPIFTFGDERCVPPDDPQSNFRMARESLFVLGAVPQKSIARMRGEIDPKIAAQEYQDGLDVLATQCGEMVYRDRKSTRLNSSHLGIS